MMTASRWPARRSAGLTLLLGLFATHTYIAGSITYTVGSEEFIQDYMDIVGPGDVVEIEAGVYFEDLKTRVHGTKEDPITIRGAGGLRYKNQTVVQGTGVNSRVFEVHHSHYILEDFTIDGRILSEDPDDYKEAFRDKLLYVQGQEEPTMREGNYRSSLDGLIVRHMNIKNAGGECVRLRYFVTYADVHDNLILNCGIHDFDYNDGGKNGEGVYVGTSSNQWDDGKNPTSEEDVCLHNKIRDNHITTNGNEGVDVKEGSLHTIIEGNQIYMQLDTESGGIDSRADYTIIRYNYIEDALGAGVRLGGHKVDGHQFGVYNEVYGNEMYECIAYGVKIITSPQTKICGNIIHLPSIYDDDGEYDYVGGNSKADWPNPQEPCTDEPTATPITLQPVDPPQGTPAPAGIRAPTPAPGMIPVDKSPAPTPASAPWETLGCYVDKRNDRVMTYGLKSSLMTNEKCAAYCYSESYVYSGTQYATECWCTNSSLYDKHGTTEGCTRPCGGDPTEKCGGFYTVTVSETGFQGTGTPAPTAAPTKAELPSTTLGCFKDKSADRIMTLNSKSGGMTNELCKARCLSELYVFSGTQYANECWCGDRATYDRHGESQACTKPCKGDSADMCGGNYAMTVSNTRYETLTPAPTPSSQTEGNLTGAIGCFADKRSPRAMTLGYTSGSGMTNAKCADYCYVKGYKYSGTQNARECWCADTTTSYARHGSSSSCTLACTGSPSEFCGGSYALTVSTATPLPNLDGYEGCFTDTSNRVFKGANARSSGMTVETCVTFCKEENEDYAGLQNGTECWCGSNTDFDKFGETTCPYPCGGDPNEVCGGAWAMSVYGVDKFS